MTSPSRKWWVLAWLLMPAGIVTYHFGPGQHLLARDIAARHMRDARAAEHTGDWAGAMAAYERAIAALPVQDVQARSEAALAHASARIWKGDLAEALSELEDLTDQSCQDCISSGLARRIRAETAEAQYYAGWLMRLEGAAADEWTPETEAARQQFRLLAEQALCSNTNLPASLFQTNLEATVRLALMDTSDLKAIPLPAKMMNCQGNDVSQKIRKQRESRAKKKGKKPG